MPDTTTINQGVSGQEKAPVVEKTPGQPIDNSSGGTDRTPQKQLESKPVEVIDASTYNPPVRKTPKPWGDTDEGRREFFQKIHGPAKKKDDDGGENGEDVPGSLKLEDVQRIFVEGFEKVLTPVLDHVRSSADEAGIASFLNTLGNERFRRYEQLARKDMAAYPNVPIEKIFRSLAFDDALAQGAESYRKVKESDKENKISGRTSRPTKMSNAPDFNSMSEKEFSEFQDRVRMGESIKVEGEEE